MYEIARERQGAVLIRNGLLYARVRYTDHQGRRRELVRRAGNRTEAKSIIDDLLAEVEKIGYQGVEVNQDMTFDELSDRYSEIKHTEAIYRELEVLRAVLNFAVNEGIIRVSPFEKATTPLISKADEVRRVRVLSRDEETRLLALCDQLRSDSSPLAKLLVCALDTGMLKGEMLALRWSDIDFDARTITIRALTTKTLTSRTIPLSSRIAKVLEARERTDDAIWPGLGDFKKE